MYIDVDTASEISLPLTSFLISYHLDVMTPTGFVPVEKNKGPSILSRTISLQMNLEKGTAVDCQYKNETTSCPTYSIY